MTVNAKANGTTHKLLEQTDIFDMIYPVGSIYWCKSESECPLSKYGGTWRVADFEIISQANTMFGLDVEAGTLTNNQNVRIYQTNNSLAQRWSLGMKSFKSDESLGFCLAWVRIA